ncbi:protein kinase C-binding protein NELL2-like [Mya arenaria]|uniref:protein kinase C-binding protein NELL2-like n=1 Tax=Mya arenaria TaxID=6604 RepID=UPI0022E292C2|nr:protein kinase C-binding protein NELL2-like [Mya arenaria]
MGFRIRLCIVVSSLALLLGTIVSGLSLGSARTTTIDFLQYLNRSNTNITYTIGPEPPLPAIYIQDSSRGLVLPENAVRDALMLLHNNDDVTFLATIRQEAGDSGSIFSFTAGVHRYLDLQISGGRDELILYYSHDQQIHSATFPYRLADGHWHEIALTFKGASLTLRVNCTNVYERVLSSLDIQSLAGNSIQIHIGGRGSHGSHFRVALQELRLVAYKDGLQQDPCPPQQETIECPMCAEFQSFQNKMNLLYNRFQKYNITSVQQAEEDAGLERCECLKSCEQLKQLVPHTLFQMDQCRICACNGSTLECRSQPCPEPECANPVINDGDCCPSCPMKRKCRYQGVFYEHGTTMSPKSCHICVCDDGVMQCDRQDPMTSCPRLDCPVEDLLHVQGQCCPICRGTDFCSRGHNCHSNATCINLSTRFTCQCRRGFQGNGSYCEDINECLETGGRNGHYCHTDQKCENTIGSYKCKCMTEHSHHENQSCASTLNGQMALFPITWVVTWFVSVITLWLCKNIQLRMR